MLKVKNKLSKEVLSNLKYIDIKEEPDLKEYTFLPKYTLNILCNYCDNFTSISVVDNMITDIKINEPNKEHLFYALIEDIELHAKLTNAEYAELLTQEDISLEHIDIILTSALLDISNALIKKALDTSNVAEQKRTLNKLKIIKGKK